MRTLLFEGSVSILNKSIGIRIYKESERYSFEPSDYLQDINDMSVYKVGSGRITNSLEDLFAKIKIFKDRYTQIVKSVSNPDY